MSERPNGHFTAQRERYLFELGPHRERIAIQRWLFWHSGEFFAVLGLPLGWWCGVGLPRSELFERDYDGDVDLFAGPLHLDISVEDWMLTVNYKHPRASITSPHSPLG